jgi:hypothetical protein
VKILRLIETLPSCDDSRVNQINTREAVNNIGASVQAHDVTERLLPQHEGAVVLALMFELTGVP